MGIKEVNELRAKYHLRPLESWEYKRYRLTGEQIIVGVPDRKSKSYRYNDSLDGMMYYLHNTKTFQDLKDNLIEINKKKPMKPKRKFKLIKSLPNLLSGSILTEIDTIYEIEEDDFNDRFSLRREVVESSPEWFEEIKETVPKTWEIQSFRGKDSNTIYTKKGINSFQSGGFINLNMSEELCLSEKSGVEIYSVKRLSDSRTFTKGGWVKFKAGVSFEIDNFYIRVVDQVMLVRSKDCEMVEVLNDDLWVVKPPKKESVDKILFTERIVDGYKKFNTNSEKTHTCLNGFEKYLINKLYEIKESI